MVRYSPGYKKAGNFKTTLYNVTNILDIYLIYYSVHY